jgi:hypothetical protein
MPLYTGSKQHKRLMRGLAGGGAVAAPNPLASVTWVAQWKFNNDGNDSIGANHLTGAGAGGNLPTFTTGHLGGATGATALTIINSQYWSIADNAALSMGNVDCSFCAWVYLSALGGYQTILAKQQASREYRLYVENGTNLFTFEVSQNGGSFDAIVQATNSGAPSTGTWHCVVAWHDSVADTINLSINDVSETPTAYALGINDGTDAFTIGQLASTFFWGGCIDNVCIAKSAAGGGGVLSAAQRTAFYNAGTGTETLT